MRVINTTPTMQNTFKIVETNNPYISWGEDMHLAFAAHRLLELRERYPELTLSIQIDKQLVSSYA